MKETILQFGTGVFLRAFICDFINGLQRQGLYEGSIVIVQPTPGGKAPMLRAQGNRYNLLVRGLQGGQPYTRMEKISCISRAIDPYSEYGEYIALAHNPELRFIISNTTEAGIAFRPDDTGYISTPISFPGKLSALLYERYRCGLPGFVIIPCELIDDNAARLRECLLAYAELWGLGEGYISWLLRDNHFCGSLVDRIVSGYPAGEAEDIFASIGERDALLDSCEPYHLWAIEGNYESELPLSRAGYNVIWTGDISPYKKRKLRILNGAHTAMTPAALLAGLDFVREAMADADIKRFYDAFSREILSVMGGDEESIAFSAAVYDRFCNPFIDHRLGAIAANSAEKFRIRILPTINEYRALHGEYPRALCFSLAALIMFYRAGLHDSGDKAARRIAEPPIKAVLADTSLWGEDLSPMHENIMQGCSAIASSGIRGGAEMQMLKISPEDNVYISPENGHKYAAREINAGEAIIKYGFPIGRATADIAGGAHVHTHNMATSLSGITEFSFAGGMAYKPDACRESILAYERPGGTGIRSDIWIIPTVGCVNGLAARLSAETGAFALCHPYGCSQSGDDKTNTELTLRGLALNPNAAGVLMLGLGCENSNIAVMQAHFAGLDASRIEFLSAQDVTDDHQAAIDAITRLKARAALDRRVPLPISSLKIGLKCGGSDGLSGITANPLLGRFTDKFTAIGGMAALGEIPECFGAEQVLLPRCDTRDTFDKAAAVIDGYKRYFLAHGEKIYDNPSSGNKAGGISTLEEKSLGCVQKGGRAAVTDVIRRGEFITRPGLTLLDGPGNDMVSCTSFAAAGCSMILFTTGRGTPFGAPIPTLKIATNTALAAKKPAWIDFDAGPALGGNDLLPDLWALIRDTAEGKPARNELYGNREISIFKDVVIQ